MKKSYMNWNSVESIDLVVKSLVQERVVLGDSDTVLGLLAPTTQKGRSALDLLKGRQEKPYIILIENISKAKFFADAPGLARAESLLAACWPGPLTVIFKAKAGLAPYLQGADGKVALRVPDHKGLRSALAHFEGLFSTSANLSGQKGPTSINEVAPSILNEAALIILDEPSNQPHKLPSTILDCSGSGVRLVRQGAFLRSDLEKILGEPIL